jgi:hypothetical protein
MARKNATSKCKFVVYHTHDDDRPASERIVTTQPFSQKGWSKANSMAREVALGLNPRLGFGTEKTDTYVDIECEGKAMALMNCTPNFGKELCWVNHGGPHPSETELAGTRRGRRRKKRR